MPKKSSAADAARHQKIAARAYALWERDGCPHGRDLEHWMQAEAEEMRQPRRRKAVRAAGQPAAARPRPKG